MDEAAESVVRDPETMTEQELRDEVWFWRGNTAASLFFAVGALKDKDRRTGLRDRRREVEALTDLLTSALSGEALETCFACGLPIREGEAVICDVEQGEMHAECPVDGRPRTLKPGDKVFMDPASICIDEDHPEGGDPALKPDHIVAHAHARLYDTAGVIRQVETARAALKASGKGRAAG